VRERAPERPSERASEQEQAPKRTWSGSRCRSRCRSERGLRHLLDDLTLAANVELLFDLAGFVALIGRLTDLRYGDGSNDHEHGRASTNASSIVFLKVLPPKEGVSSVRPVCFHSLLHT
jgi:hypothetical protein